MDTLTEKYAWSGKIIEGKKAEYIKRHDEIWPEMKELLTKAGIRNYTIWNVGNTLFGYYECIYGIDFASKTQAGSEVVARWDEYMKDILILDKDPVTGAQARLEKVFELN